MNLAIGSLGKFLQREVGEGDPVAGASSHHWSSPRSDQIGPVIKLTQDRVTVNVHRSYIRLNL